MTRTKITHCAACRLPAKPPSALCTKHSKLFDSGARVQCDGFVLQKRKKRGHR